LHDESSAIIAGKGWRASLVITQIGKPRILQHEESFEVLKTGVRSFFYFDDVAGRCAINGRDTKERALAFAQAYLV
jgi:hypothetical protein